MIIRMRREKSNANKYSVLKSEKIQLVTQGIRSKKKKYNDECNQKYFRILTKSMYIG